MDNFLQQLINGLTLGSIYGLIAIGYTMVYGIIGMVNFAHGDLFMLSAFIALIVFMILTQILHLSSLPLAFIIVMIAGMTLTGLWNWAIERLAYRPLRRSEILAELDSRLGSEAVFFVDAYATDLAACARRLRHPERLVGYGILASLEGQRTVEIVDSESVSDDALELAQELFATLGKGSILVEDVPGLFLGRTVGSIVNEAVVAVGEDVASAEDVDTAMRLGANYPIGPIAWGREIGGARVKRILGRLADAEGEAFAPHRSLWLLDLPDEPVPDEIPQ